MMPVRLKLNIPAESCSVLPLVFAKHAVRLPVVAGDRCGWSKGVSKPNESATLSEPKAPCFGRGHKGLATPVNPHKLNEHTLTCPVS